MFKAAAAGVTALFVTAAPLAYAQSRLQAMQDHPMETAEALTDLRIDTMKAALQLTPSQEKYWPAIEEAIRNRAQHRVARIKSLVDRVDALHESGPAEALQNRNPVDFLHRRAAALTQRGGDLEKLAEAWQPLYQTLSVEQKRRMAFLTAIVLRHARNAIEERREQFDDDSDE
jgi:hypothetical protein